MAQDEILDNDKPSKETKNTNGIFGWASVVVSVVFIFKGFNYISKDMVIWGAVLIVVGIVGLGFKVYDNIKNK